MRKKLYLYIFFLFCIAIAFNGLSSPLEIVTSGDSPFIIINNPSLLCMQKGTPIGLSCIYNNERNEYDFECGFAQIMGKSAFSFMYDKNTQDTFNTISTAFSTAYKKLFYGTTFNFIFNNSDPFFDFDIGFSYNFKETYYLELIGKNIFSIYDTPGSDGRFFVVGGGGSVPKVDRLFFNIQALCFINDIKDRDISIGGDAHIHKLFFKNPSFGLYVRGNFVYDYFDRITEWFSEAHIGYHHTIKKISFGIYGGYRYSSDSRKNSIIVSLSSNFIDNRGKNDLFYSLDLNTDFITPNGDAILEEVIVSIKGRLYSKDVKIKRWNIIISEYLKGEEKIVRSISGGSIPPSSIVWDGRNGEGNIVRNGTYTITLIIVDTQKRVFSSNKKEITVY